MEQRPTEVDIRAMRAAVGDDKAFAAISDKARFFEFLFAIRGRVAAVGKYERGLDVRMYDQAAMRRDLESLLTRLDGPHAAWLLLAACDLHLDHVEANKILSFGGDVRRMLQVNEAVRSAPLIKGQSRTIKQSVEIASLLKMMTEVGAEVSIADDCPNLALMGRLMAYTSGQAVGARTLKQRIVRMRRRSRLGDNSKAV